MAVDPELLEPFERLIQVTVEGRPESVPANNSLLRVLQYLDFDLYPCRLCWNGECDNCAFTYIDPGSSAEVCARGCETTIIEGMQITRVPKDAVPPPGRG